MTDTCTPPTPARPFDTAAADAALADLALAAMLDLLIGAQALAPMRQACEELLARAEAGDRAGAAAVLSRVCQPEPVEGDLDDDPYPGVSLLGTYAIEAVQERWPEGVHPEPARLAARLLRERGPLAVDCLAVACAEALELADWGDDDPALRGWVTTQGLPTVPGSVLGVDVDALPQAVLALADRHRRTPEDVIFEMAAVVAATRLPQPA